MAEDRQAERRLADEDIAGERLEGGAGRVGLALVIARDDDALPALREPDLRRAQHVAGGMEAHIDVAEPQALAVARRSCARRRNSAPWRIAMMASVSRGGEHRVMARRGRDRNVRG